MSACLQCATTIGLVPMPPVTRPPRACSCGGRKFLRAIPREHGSHSVRMALTHPAHGQPGLFSKPQIDTRRGWGVLEVFVCYACNKVEWYCADVENVPIHPHLMTDVVDYDEGGPYR